MKLKNFLYILYIVIVSFVFLLIFYSCKKKNGDYNLIVITIDTLRADRVSLYSRKYLETKNIDSIGNEGIVFKRAFTEVPLTFPSHTTILTGLTPLGHGIHDNIGFKLSESVKLISEVFKNNGFYTIAVVSALPLDKRYGLNRGFNVYDDNYGEKNENDIFFPERRARKSIKLSINYIKKRKSEKFFLWLHLFDPHQPYDPPEPYKSKYKNDLYSGEVAYVDNELGKFFDFLRKEGLYKNTVIIVTADHGEALGEHGERTHGYFAYNSTLWIPLIIRIPGEKHRIVDNYVSLSDIYPTICEIEKFNCSGYQGKSLMDFIKGKSKSHKKFIYFESLSPYYSRGWAPLYGIIDVENKIKFIDQPIKELYLLDNDFYENKNVWNSLKFKRYVKILENVKNKLIKKNNVTKKMVTKEELKRFETLGYVGGIEFKNKKKHFTKDDDLKTLLPVQNKMLDALALYSKGNYGESLRLLSDIVRSRKDFVGAWNRIVSIFKEIGLDFLAIETAKKALLFNPNNYSLLLSYGGMLAKYGDSGDAIKILLKAKKIKDFEPELWNALGIAYWKAGEIEKAEDSFKKAIEIDDNFALAYANMGLMYIDLRFYDKAKIYLEKALEISPNLVAALNGMGALLKKQGKKKEAINYWIKAMKVSPHCYEVYYNLISTLIELREYKKALEWYNKALKNLYILKNMRSPNLIELNKLRDEAEAFLNE